MRFREDQALQATPEQRVQQEGIPGYHGRGSTIETREPQVLQATQEQREQQEGIPGYHGTGSARDERAPSTASDARAARAARGNTWLSWNGTRERRESPTHCQRRKSSESSTTGGRMDWGRTNDYSSFVCKDVLPPSVQRAGPSRTPTSHSGLSLPRSWCRSNTRITSPARARTPSRGMRSPRLRRTGNSKTSTMRAHHTGSPRRRLD